MAECELMPWLRSPVLCFFPACSVCKLGLARLLLESWKPFAFAASKNGVYPIIAGSCFIHTGICFGLLSVGLENEVGMYVENVGRMLCKAAPTNEAPDHVS